MHVSPPHVELPHIVFFVHGRHAVGSARFVSLQFGEAVGLVRMSKHIVGFAGSQIVQQPKQSQPGGASLPQVSMHFCDKVPVPSGAGHSATL